MTNDPPSSRPTLPPGVREGHGFSPRLLEGKVALITGGGSGLGRSMAHRFSALGARIVMGGRREDVLRGTSEELRSLGGEVAYQITDVRDAAQADALVQLAYERFGQLDILVNNAAGNFLARSEKLSAHAFDSVVRTVLHGTFHMTRSAAERWISRERPGVVLNISTPYAWTGAAHVVPSAAAKAGVLALTRSLAVEWARYRIRLNALAPGPIPTEGAWERLVPSEDVARTLEENVPMGRFGTHRELCDLATFLVSDASSYITGQVIAMDGGEWLVGSGFQLLRRVPPAFWESLEEAHRRSRRTGAADPSRDQRD